MTIVHELNVWDYEPWSGAVETYERICQEGKLDALDALLDELFHNHMTDTELNDLLWFDSDSVYEWLGMKTDDEIEDERRRRQERRKAIARLTETASAEEFCDLWMNDLDLDCTACPLFREVDCNADEALCHCKQQIAAEAAQLLDKIEEEEGDT